MPKHMNEYGVPTDFKPEAVKENKYRRRWYDNLLDSAELLCYPLLVVFFVIFLHVYTTSQQAESDRIACIAQDGRPVFTETFGGVQVGCVYDQKR